MSGARQRLLLTSALAAWLAAVSSGQEPAAPPPAAPPAAPPVREETERETPPPETPPGNTDGASEDEFIPTEELPPDSAINFPVDI
jgi:hypothetical protein